MRICICTICTQSIFLKDEPIVCGWIKLLNVKGSQTTNVLMWKTVEKCFPAILENGEKQFKFFSAVFGKTVQKVFYQQFSRKTAFFLPFIHSKSW